MTKRTTFFLSLFLLISLLLPSTISFAQPTPTSWIRVNHGNDDAEEQHGRINLTSNDIEMVENKNKPQLAGLRFSNVKIPRDAVIYQAVLFFTADSADSKATNLVIHGEYKVNSLPFNQQNISSRRKTSASTAWNNVGAWQEDKMYASPSLVPIIQEVVTCTGWDYGDPLTFIVSGNGKRSASSFNRGSGQQAPMLYIKWRPGTPQPCSGE